MSEQEMIESDPFQQENIIKGMLEELKLIEWPSVGKVLQQAIISTVALAVFIYFVLTLDATIKEFYQGIHLYPVG